MSHHEFVHTGVSTITMFHLEPFCTTVYLDEFYLFYGLERRSYYSPLVESFESKGHKSRHGTGSATDTNNSSELITISRSGNVLPGPASESLGTSREQHGARSEEGQEGNDGMSTSPEDPIAAAYGDDTPMEKIAGLWLQRFRGTDG